MRIIESVNTQPTTSNGGASAWVSLVLPARGRLRGIGGRRCTPLAPVVVIVCIDDACDHMEGFEGNVAVLVCHM